jgi:hypothetical protein
MTRLPSRLLLAAVCAGIWASGPAGATAQLGGVIDATFVSGNCNQSAQVPLTTLQDNFALNLAVPCSAGAVSGSLKGSSATGSIGLTLTASGNGFAAATVALVDFWYLTPPPGTAAGFYTIQATLHIDGTAAGVPVLGNYLTYTMTLLDFNSSLPNGRIDGIGAVTTPGAYSQTFSAPLSVRYFGPGGGPAVLQVALQMSVPNLNAGTVDFFNTGFAALSLLPGWTAVTSSGLPVTPVPEPAAAVLMLLGAGALALRRASALSRAR